MCVSVFLVCVCVHLVSLLRVLVSLLRVRRFRSPWHARSMRLSSSSSRRIFSCMDLRQRTTQCSVWATLSFLVSGLRCVVCGEDIDLILVCCHLQLTPCMLSSSFDLSRSGIVIALLLRFDRSRSPSSSPYFVVGMIAYLLGLGTTIFVMHTFKAAQVSSCRAQILELLLSADVC